MQTIAVRFLIVALLALLAGLTFGLISGLQYAWPEFLDKIFPFVRLRPLHVTCVVTWIFTAAAGGIYYYLPEITGRKLSLRLAKTHFVLFLLTGTAILLSYLFGWFGGREYLEFPPVLGIPLLLCWILFLVNVARVLPWKAGKWPVYLWMWATGIFFFIITLAESYLWMLPWFGNNFVRDVTVQWKALGAMVGCWNMMVYGTAFYVMEKASGNTGVARAPLTFFFYFLGLVNLMFNWGHHTYPVPAEPWIRMTAYLISMTELVLLGYILYTWRKSVRQAVDLRHDVSCRFLSAADAWIFLNLCLAIAISVPAINRYTHGTHVTVAHAMGATIGINTMILFASLFFISKQAGGVPSPTEGRLLSRLFWLAQVSLFVFWISLLGAGIFKAIQTSSGADFPVIMSGLQDWFHAFALSGLFLVAGIGLTAIFLLKKFSKLPGS